MTAHHRLVELVRHYLGTGHFSEVEQPDDVLDCVLSLPPDAVPDRPRLRRVAWDFVAAFAAGSTEGLRLPPGVGAYVDAWLAGKPLKKLRQPRGRNPWVWN